MDNETRALRNPYGSLKSIFVSSHNILLRKALRGGRYGRPLPTQEGQQEATRRLLSYSLEIPSQFEVALVFYEFVVNCQVQHKS